MKILIIGASGLVGGACLQVLSKKEDWKVLGTHKSFPTETTVYFDVKQFNPTDIEMTPDVIIYCGGLTWVDYCEEHPDESFDENVAPISKLTSWAKLIQAKFIYTSTDYVFDGEDGPYKEEDLPNPINVYGLHKLNAEQIIKEELEDFIILRFTNVYGKEDRNKNMLARLINQARANKSMEIIMASDQFASPIYSVDIADAIQCLIHDDRKGVFHLSSSDYLSRVEFAQLCINHFKVNHIKILPKETALLDQKAKRPLKGGLSNMKFRSLYPSFNFTKLATHIKTLEL